MDEHTADALEAAWVAIEAAIDCRALTRMLGGATAAIDFVGDDPHATAVAATWIASVLVELNVGLVGDKHGVPDLSVGDTLPLLKRLVARQDVAIGAAAGFAEGTPGT